MKPINKTPFKRALIVPLLLSLFFLNFLLVQSSQAKDDVVKKGHHWSFLSGYGSSHPGWGETETRVETVDVLARYSIIMIDDMGSSWYRGYHSLLIEPVFHLVFNPDGSSMIGLNFLGCYTFSEAELFTPYIFGGGGPIYVDADIAGMGAHWNGNYQFGAGIEWKLNEDHSLLFEVRYHHISNGNRSEPNIPLNSTKFLTGFTF